MDEGPSERVPLSLLGQENLGAVERVCKRLAIVTVHEHDAIRRASLDESHELVVSRVRGEIELPELETRLHELPVDLHHPLVHESSPVRPWDLEAREADRAVRIVLDR